MSERSLSLRQTTDIQFRLYLDNDQASQEILDRIEEIVVEQEVDMAWEARIQMPIALDEEGNWEGEDDDFMQPFSRVRIEVRVGDGDFTPLIDGPLVGFNNNKTSEPGQSTMTLTVRDDSILLNREDRITRFEDIQDHEIAEQIFREFGDVITDVDVERTPSTGNSLASDVFQRGTAMQLLRQLARRQGMHAYVLPGDGPGRSIGVFRSFTTRSDGLPSLVLLGAERNIEDFSVRQDMQRPAVVQAATIRISDREIVTSSSSYHDLDLMGDPSIDQGGDLSTIILPPFQGESVDLDQATRGRASRYGYSFEASGSVREFGYPGILQPYRVVAVEGGNSQYSGDYLITQVTHTITRSSYTQNFTMRRNASSGRHGSASAGSSSRGIF